MNVVTRSNGQKRSFSTLIRVLSVFDREDLDAVYKLVMDIYQDKIPEGFDKVLWGDLIVMFNPDEQDEFWSSQHEWKVVSWKLHTSSGMMSLKGLQEALYIAEVLDLHLVLLWRDKTNHRSALGMERDCQHGLYKAGMGSSRVLSDFAEKYGSKNRVLAGFGIGGKSGKGK
ncbi:hypothetical protein Tco_0642172, partial [Tanacetum coccineum]